jgi:hypothetical protein
MRAASSWETGEIARKLPAIPQGSRELEPQSPAVARAPSRRPPKDSAPGVGLQEGVNLGLVHAGERSRGHRSEQV